jgi:hypothetical protein
MKNNNNKKIELAKSIRIVCCFFMLGIMLLSSCSTTGITSKKTKTWITGSAFLDTRKIALGNIDIDKPGGGWSVEKEIMEILPLILSEQGFVVLQNKENADGIVDVFATERDFYSGWKTNKSIAVEVLFYPSNGGTGNIDGETSFAAGRTVAQGSLGLSSSKNVEALLRDSVKKLARSIKKNKFI